MGTSLENNYKQGETYYRVLFILQEIFLKNNPMYYSIISVHILYYKYYVVPYNVVYCFFCRTTYRVLCLGWYKTCRGQQGFSTHKLNSWAFSGVLVVESSHHVIIVLLYFISTVLVLMFFWSCCKLSLSLFGVLIPYHYCIPPFIDRLNNIRQSNSDVNGLTYITKHVDKGCLKPLHIWWI